MYNRYNTQRSQFRNFLGIVIVAVIVVVSVYAVTPVFRDGPLANVITADKALEQFKKLAKTPDVVIDRMSNTAPVFGNFFDVSFDLIIDGELKYGRCTSDWFSPIFCRIYDPGSGE